MPDSGNGRRAKRASHDLRISVYSQVVVTLLVVIAGAFLALTSSSRWTAEQSIVVLPSSGLESGAEASFYEYLSRGQLVATFSEVGNDAQSLRDAQNSVGMNEADRAESSVSLSVVPGTSVVLVQATAPTSDQAVALADATTELARTDFDRLDVPFRTLAGATGAAMPSGPSKALILIATLVAALVAGIAVQQATLAILRARRGPTRVARAQVSSSNGEPTEPQPVST